MLCVRSREVRVIEINVSENKGVITRVELPARLEPDTTTTSPNKKSRTHQNTPKHITSTSTYSGAVDLDLVRVHGGVGDENLRVLDAPGLPHAETLLVGGRKG